MSDQPNVMRVVYYVEVGVCDEATAGAIRQALAKRLRENLGPETHVQVTMDFSCGTDYESLAAHVEKDPVEPEPQSEAERVVAAFRAKRKFLQS